MQCMEHLDFDFFFSYVFFCFFWLVPGKATIFFIELYVHTCKDSVSFSFSQSGFQAYIHFFFLFWFEWLSLVRRGIA